MVMMVMAVMMMMPVMPVTPTPAYLLDGIVGPVLVDCSGDR